MRMTPKRLLAILLLVCAYQPASTYATNGYFMIGYGAKSRGMGGVGTAYGQDGLAAAYNPAAMIDVKMNTMRIDAGLELFNPPRGACHDSALLETESDSAVCHESGANEYLIPSMGGIYKFNRKLTVGMAVIGNGAGTRYNQEVPGLPGCENGMADPSGGSGSTLYNFQCNADSKTAGAMLLQMQMLPSVAYKVNKNHSIGASLAIGVQMFRAYGLGAFKALGYAGGTDHLSGEGNDWSYGAGVRAGWLGKFFKKRLSVGLNYASRVYMTEFDKYDNLFAEQGDFDIPEHFSLGISYRPNNKLTLAADVQKILYSDIKSMGNLGPDTIDLTNFNPNPGCEGADDDTPEKAERCLLGGDQGMGFGWDDATVYKVGVNYDYNNEWSFRAGYNYGETVIEDDQVLFNILATATVEHHLTLGASYRPNRNMEWSFNYMHAFENVVKGPTPFPPEDNGGLPVIGENASISMRQNALGVSFAYSM